MPQTKNQRNQPPADQDLIRVTRQEFFSAIGKFNELTKRGKRIAVAEEDGTISMVLGAENPTPAEVEENARRIAQIQDVLDSVELTNGRPDRRWLE